MVVRAEIRPSDTRDWFLLSSWLPIYEHLRLAPTDIPGVRALPHGLSDRKPFPQEVHRTHLALLGLDPPAPADVSAAEILRPHQHTAVNFIRSRRGTLLADEQRVGKTAATMYAFEPAAGPLLVVGPLAARAPWSEWAHRRFGGCADASCAVCARLGLKESTQPSFLALEGRTFRPKLIAEQRPRVMFCTYAVVSTWRELSLSLLGQAGLTKLGMLALDECHLAGIQNRKSLTYESTRWLNTITEQVVALTGTPLFNKPAGLWPVLDLCAPTAFGNFWDCARRYFGARPTEHGWQATGFTNEREFRLRLEEIMLRRTWRDIAENLPPITRSIETVALSQTARDEIEELAGRLRYAQGSAKTAVGILSRLRRLYASAKLEHGIRTALTTVQDGHSTIVWSWHTDVAEKLAEALRRKGVVTFGPITGKVTGREREAILDEAEKHRGPCVLVAGMAALGFAVDLSWASHEIFVELDFSPPVISQAEMRPYSGKQPISATFLVADCDSDEALVEALISKLENQKLLGVSAGVGDVADVLQRTFKLEGRSLSDLADQLMANAEGEV